MHECPECGQACYCSGDLDDCQVFTEEWAFVNCTHPTKSDCDIFHEDEWDEDWGDYETSPTAKGD